MQTALHLVAIAVVACGSSRAVDSPAAAPDAGAVDTSSNPYLAPADLPVAELGTYLERLLAKPQSLRSRPGYRQAVLDTTDRILAADPPSVGEPSKELAVLTRLDLLGELIRVGETKRAAELAEFAQAHREDKRPAVAARAELRGLECRILYRGEHDQDQVAELLAELRKYFSATLPAADHLRLASATVGLINKLEDRKHAEKLYDEFGQRFAKSPDKKLSRYGQKILGGKEEPRPAGELFESP